MGILEWLAPGPRRSRGIALALGGGGARGVAHIGVIETLEAAGVPVAALAGSSAGAVVGGMWLALGSATAMAARWREFLSSGLLPGPLPDILLASEVSSRDNLLLHFAKRLMVGATVVLALERRSLVDLRDFERALEFLLPDVDIEDLPVPFTAVSTDFATGEVYAPRTGSLRRTATASSAVPGVVPPVTIGGRAYVDGGVVSDVPVEQARELGPWPVVAVDVGEDPGPVDPEHVKVPRALLRAGIITHRALRSYALAAADLVISPAVGGIHWSEFSRSEEALAAGRAAAEAALPAVRALARPRLLGAHRRRPLRLA